MANEHVKQSTMIEWIINRIDEAKGVAMFRTKNAKQVYTYWEDELRDDCLRAVNLLQQARTMLDLIKRNLKD